MLRQWPAFAGDRPPDRAALQRLVDDAGAGWVLVDPASTTGYEAAIGQGRIPTREDSWHDAFNVLAFVRWPQAKRALHARVLQCQRARTDGPRSREEDALALLDEAVIVVSGRGDAIAGFDRAREHGDIAGMTAAIDRGLRARWFGHALLEHLALRRPPIGAGVLVLQTDDDDGELAARISAGRFVAPCFAPTVPWPDDAVLGWLHD
jgi:hypothetical protein